MRKILVTGGAGFIGSNLCKRLLSEGNQVICLDDLSTGSKKNIEDCLQDSRFQFVCHDVTQPYDFDVQQIYNLACPASPVHYQEDPIHTAMTNVLGARNALDLATRRGATVLQASTSEIYGEPQVHPQVEGYRGNVNPIGIRACYDEGKRMAETLFFDCYRMFGTKIRVVRIFNTYGPNMMPDDGRVVSNFILQALKGEDITIYGDGSQTRCFCYVDDTVEALIRMMNNTEDFTGPVNLGNPDEKRVGQLAEKVIAAVGSPSKLIYCSLPKDDPTRRRPDITLAQQKLGWTPKVMLDEGLEKTIAYFRKCANEDARDE